MGWGNVRENGEEETGGRGPAEERERPGHEGGVAGVDAEAQVEMETEAGTEAWKGFTHRPRRQSEQEWRCFTQEHFLHLPEQRQ